MHINIASAAHCFLKYCRVLQNLYLCFLLIGCACLLFCLKGGWLVYKQHLRIKIMFTQSLVYLSKSPACQASVFLTDIIHISQQRLLLLLNRSLLISICEEGKLREETK